MVDNTYCPRREKRIGVWMLLMVRRWFSMAISFLLLESKKNWQVTQFSVVVVVVVDVTGKFHEREAKERKTRLKKENSFSLSFIERGWQIVRHLCLSIIPTSLLLLPSKERRPSFRLICLAKRRGY